MDTQTRRNVRGLSGPLNALFRDHATIKNLLSYQLVGGVTSATDNPFEKDI